jgi:predicted transcriptional regulator
MTYPATVVQRATELAKEGTSTAAIARTLGVSRAAVRDWLCQDFDALVRDGGSCTTVHSVNRATTV